MAMSTSLSSTLPGVQVDLKHLYELSCVRDSRSQWFAAFILNALAKAHSWASTLWPIVLSWCYCGLMRQQGRQDLAMSPLPAIPCEGAQWVSTYPGIDKHNTASSTRLSCTPSQ